MIGRKLLLLVIAGFVLITSACGPFFSRPIRNPLLIDIRTSTPTPTATGPTTSPTPSPGFTPTSTGAYFTLTRNANCHNGPGPAYDVVLILSVGETVDVIGRNRDNTWWRIYRDLLMDCWVANEAGIFAGVVAMVPITSSQYATQQALTPLSPTKTKVVQIVQASTNTAVFIPASPTNPPSTSTVRPPATNTAPPPATNTDPPPTTTALPTIELPPAATNTPSEVMP